MGIAILIKKIVGVDITQKFGVAFIAMFCKH
jgi:hypothetical protein